MKRTVPVLIASAFLAGCIPGGKSGNIAFTEDAPQDVPWIFDFDDADILESIEGESEEYAFFMGLGLIAACNPKMLNSEGRLQMLPEHELEITDMIESSPKVTNRAFEDARTLVDTGAIECIINQIIT